MISILLATSGVTPCCTVDTMQVSGTSSFFHIFQNRKPYLSWSLVRIRNCQKLSGFIKWSPWIGTSWRPALNHLVCVFDVFYRHQFDHVKRCDHRVLFLAHALIFIWLSFEHKTFQVTFSGIFQSDIQTAVPAILSSRKHMIKSTWTTHWWMFWYFF